MIQRAVTAVTKHLQPHACTQRVARNVAALAALGLLLGGLPGCQSISGSPSAAQVRLIDASPDAGGLGCVPGQRRTGL